MVPQAHKLMYMHSLGTTRSNFSKQQRSQYIYQYYTYRFRIVDNLWPLTNLYFCSYFVLSMSFTFSLTFSDVAAVLCTTLFISCCLVCFPNNDEPSDPQSCYSNWMHIVSLVPKAIHPHQGNVFVTQCNTRLQ